MNLILHKKADKSEVTLESVVNTVTANDISDYSKIRYVADYLTDAISSHKLYTPDRISVERTLHQASYTYQELTLLYGPLHSYDEASRYTGQYGLFFMLQDFDTFFGFTLTSDPANKVSTDGKGEYIQLSDRAVDTMRAVHDLISELDTIRRGHDESKIVSTDWTRVVQESEAYRNSSEANTQYQIVISYIKDHSTT
jgi:hypothetical protein